MERVNVTNAWIVRAGSDRIDRLQVGRGVITVGWKATGDLPTHGTLDQIRDLIVAAHPDLDPARAEGHVFQLVAFVRKMEPGDAVLVPRHGTPTVAIGKITGPYLYQANFDQEVGHTRSVRWIEEEIPRVAFGADLIAGSALNAIQRINAPDAVNRIWQLAQHHQDPLLRSGESAEPLNSPAPLVTPLTNLQRNLNYARSLAIAGQRLGELDVRSFKVDDVFRAAWVQGVAALDHWVRQEIHARMLRLARDGGPDRPSGFAKFEITLDLVERVHRGELTLHEALDIPLWAMLSRTTYQRPDRIREGFALVCDTSGFWDRVAAVLSERHGGGSVSTREVRDRLNEIVERRNKIAHEYDEDPLQPRGKRSIDAAGATATIEWIDQLVAAIVEVLDRPEREAPPSGLDKRC